jgi:hypothetical protein
VPGLIFWFVVRRSDGNYTDGTEGLVLVAVPVVAGVVFALLTPRPVWRRSVLFTLVYGVLPALLTILVIYPAGDSPFITGGPLAVAAAWLLCWFAGALPAGLTSRLRTWRMQGGTLQEWGSGWWTRRRCKHNWELVQTVKLPGRVGHQRYAGEIGYHNLYYYHCRNCGAKKTQSDRWGPVSDRRF